ncbi:MAG: hypothetical protein ACHQHN_04260 [Sphingobacteriales bacterium]
MKKLKEQASILFIILAAFRYDNRNTDNKNQDQYVAEYIRIHSSSSFFLNTNNPSTSSFPLIRFLTMITMTTKAPTDMTDIVTKKAVSILISIF